VTSAPFQLLPLLLNEVPATVAFTPGHAADASSAVSCPTTSALRGSWLAPFRARSNARAVRNTASNSSATSNLIQFLVVNILAGAHCTANHNRRNGRVVIWTTATPPYAAQQAAPAETVETAFFSKAPRCLELRIGLEAKVTLPSLGLDLLCSCSCRLCVLQRVDTTRLCLSVCHACRLDICKAWLRRT